MVATGIVFTQSFTDLHPDHGLDERGHDRSEQTAQTAKPDRGAATDKEADTCRALDGQIIQPSAANRVVAEASAPVTAAEDGGSPGEELEKWIDEYADESLRAVGEGQEKRKEEP